MTPKAGDIYRAIGSGRMVVVMQVRGLKGPSPYVLAREATRRGRPKRGRTRDGISREIPIAIRLTFHDGLWTLPAWYELAKGGDA